MRSSIGSKSNRRQSKKNTHLATADKNATYIWLDRCSEDKRAESRSRFSRQAVNVCSSNRKDFQVQQLAIDLSTIREILFQHGRLSQDARLLEPDSCLHNVGLTSLATVSVMLALEDQFNIEFPESMLSRRTFESLDSIADAVAKLVG